MGNHKSAIAVHVQQKCAQNLSEDKKRPFAHQKKVPTYE